MKPQYPPKTGIGFVLLIIALVLVLWIAGKGIGLLLSQGLWTVLIMAGIGYLIYRHLKKR